MPRERSWDKSQVDYTNLVLVTPMSPTPIPTRVALLEERATRVDVAFTSMDEKLDEIRITLARRAERDVVYDKISHALTVIVSASIAAIVTYLPKLWTPR